MPFWLPAGAAIRHALEKYVRQVERRAGYRHVYSPVLGKQELYEVSGCIRTLPKHLPALPAT